jgi:RNA polymerase sigma factor (sigma-70 family)
MPILQEEEIEKLRPKVRFRIAYQVGFACPDVDDLVQETLARFLIAVREDKVRDPDALGGFLNGMCRNVVFEYRRRVMREDPMPETVPDLADRRISGAQQFEIRDAILLCLAQLSPRDRQILHEFYVEEKSKEEIIVTCGLTYEQFRVVLCRAKERFRGIYNQRLQHHSASRH